MKKTLQNENNVSLLLKRLQFLYAPLHGYVSIGVCVVGSVCSVLVVLVLTRKKMSSGTSTMLTTLAISDLLTMLIYVPFALHYYCFYGPLDSLEKNTKAWSYFCLFYAHISVTTHTISIWIAVVLAIFRYVQVKMSLSRPTNPKNMQDNQNMTLSK